MARNLEEFKQELARAEKSAEAMARQGYTEPLPLVTLALVDPMLDAQLRGFNAAFDKIFGAGR